MLNTFLLSLAVALTGCGGSSDDPEPAVPTVTASPETISVPTDGGTYTVNVTTTLAHSPLYIKAGSIMPMSPEVQYANENKFDNLDIVVYPGANAKFTLYEDEGDNYNYEKGAYSTIELTWNDKAKSLTIGKRQGSFEGMLVSRRFNVKVIGGKTQTVNYSGKSISVK